MEDRELRLKWGAGSLLAVKSTLSSTGWLLVQVGAKSVSEDVVDSDTPFQARLYRQTDNLNYHPTKPAVMIEVSPRNVLRPVELKGRGEVPGPTLQWILDYFVSQAINDELTNKKETKVREEQTSSSEDGEDDNDEDGDASEDDGGAAPLPTAAAKKRAAPKPKTSKAAKKKKDSGETETDKDDDDDDDDKASTEADEDGDDDDDDDGEVGKKRARGKGRAAASKPSPKRTSSASPPRPKPAAKAPKPSPKKPAVGAKRTREPKAPKPPKAPKAAKKQKPPALEVVEKPAELYATSNELNPTSHLEAMRAALTSNVVLFKKVLASPEHVKWLTCSRVPDAETSSRGAFSEASTTMTPLHVIVDKADPNMLEVLATSKFGGTNAAAAPYRPFGSMAQAVTFTSLFDGTILHDEDHSAASRAWGTGVAVPKGSILRVQSAGTASFNTFGRHVRNLAAGRGSRELGNAFTSPFNEDNWQPSPQYLPLFQRQLGRPDCSEAAAVTLHDIMVKEAKKREADAVAKGITSADATATVSDEKSAHADMYMHVGNLARCGEAEWVLRILKDKGLNAGLETGKFHLLALDPSTTVLPPEAKNVQASILKKGVESATPLHYACINPNSACLKAMLSELTGTTPPLSVADNQQMTILHYAAASKTTTALTTLFEGVPGLSRWQAAGYHKLAPAHVAATLDRADNLRLLLKEQTEQQLNAQTRTNRTPLLLAIATGSANAVAAILDAVPNKEAKKKLVKQNIKGTGFTTLHLAVRIGSVPIVQLLLGAGASLEVKDRHKRTPFLIAAKSGHLHVLSYLASRGAKTAASDSSANQAVHYAAAYGHIDCLAYLIEKCGAQANAETSWKMTPFGLAVLSGFSSTCGKYLLSKCASDINVNFRDDKYNTILHTVVEADYTGRLPEMVAHVTYLLSLGVDPTLAKADGSTALHLLAASQNGDTQRNILRHYLQGLEAKVKAREIADGKDLGLTQLAAALQASATPTAMSPAGSPMRGKSFRKPSHDEDDDDDDDGDGDEDEDGDDDDDDDGDGDGEDGGHDEDGGDGDGDEDEDEDENEDEDEDENEDADEGNGVHPFSTAVGKPPAKRGGAAFDAGEKPLPYHLRSMFTGQLHNAALVSIGIVKQEIDRVKAQLARPNVELVVAKLLIDAIPADKRISTVNAQNATKETALLVALQKGNFEMVRFLLNHGASVTLVDAEGRTVLHHLLAQPTPFTLQLVDETIIGKAALAQLFVAYDNDGMTPIHRLMSTLIGISQSVGAAAEAKAKATSLVRDVIVVLQYAGKLAPASLTTGCGPFVIPNGSTTVPNGATAVVTAGAPPPTPPTNQAPQIPRMCTQLAPVTSKPSLAGFAPFEDEDPKKLPPTPVKLYLTHHWFGRWTALHFAACLKATPEFLPVLDALLSATPKAAAAARDIRGNTPLAVAVLSQTVAEEAVTVCNRLLAHHGGGASGAAGDDDENGETPIMKAVLAKSPMAETLLRTAIGSPTLLSLRDKKGRTVLHRLCALRHDDWMRLILGSGAAKALQVDGRDNFGRTPLHYALSFGGRQAFATFKFEQGLLSHGADPMAVDNLGRTCLHYCFVDLDGEITGPSTDPIEAVGSLIPRFRNPLDLINARDKEGNTALKCAVVRKAVTSTLLLVGKGADLSIADGDGNVPITAGLLAGATDLVCMLVQALKKKLDGELFAYQVSWPLDSVTQKKVKMVTKISACLYAMQQKWNGVCYLLLEAGFPKRLAIADAIKVGLVDLAEGLIDKLPAADRKQLAGPVDEQGWSLLHFMAKTAEPLQDIFDCLVNEVRCDVNAVSMNGRTPILFVEAGNIRKLQQFHKAKANFAHRDSKGVTVLSNWFTTLPLNADRRAMVTKIVKEFGASPDFSVEVEVTATNTTKPSGGSDSKAAPDAVTWRYQNGVSRCLSLGDLETVVLLIQLGAALNLQDSEGDTLLMQAIRQRQHEALRLLLRSDRDLGVNLKNRSGHTALHIAITNNDTTSVEIICTSKLANLDVTDNVGRTALHYVVSPLPFGSFENVDILRLLLTNGAKATLRDQQGYTAPEYTIPQSTTTLASVFESFGIAVPAMSRISSIISTAVWDRSHAVVDVARDSAAVLASLDAAAKTAATAAAEPKLVDPKYFVAKGDSAKTVVVVWSDYDAIMTKVDVAYGAMGLNLFYKLQVLHDTIRGVWVLWTRYGGIGQEGQFQATPFSTAAVAVKEFETLFKQKTSNEWSMRTSFAKVPGKWRYHDIAAHRPVELSNVLRPFTPQELAAKPLKMSKPVAELLAELSDVTSMTQQHKMTGVQASAFPLGRLPRATLERGLEILGLIKDELQAPVPNDATRVKVRQERHEKVAELTNEYYELIPHAEFSHDKVSPPVNVNGVQQMWDKLKVMMDLESASQLLLGARARLDTYHPLEYVFAATKTDIYPLDRKGADEPEFNTLLQYFHNSVPDHAQHQKVHAIFRVQRRGEAEEMQAFCRHIGNRRLLWHGSASTNVLSILTMGLCVAPPSAPVSGYAFGKGIYFADLASKSLGYAHRIGKSSIMLICEVALGNSVEEVSPVYREALPDGFHSVKAFGQSAPQSGLDVVLNNGAVVPLGPVGPQKPTAAHLEKLRSGGAYFGNAPSAYPMGANEYIVFKSSQVRIRYLFQLQDEKATNPA